MIRFGLEQHMPVLKATPHATALPPLRVMRVLFAGLPQCGFGVSWLSPGGTTNDNKPTWFPFGLMATGKSKSEMDAGKRFFAPVS